VGLVKCVNRCEQSGILRGFSSCVYVYNGYQWVLRGVAYMCGLGVGIGRSRVAFC